ncbi:MAG TPA: T9SS type A sorting domain-containing protein [Bacteroidales bacterium]|nr:T9SS type A sorting domain-containing protein [Bacteroidales bacterium]HRX98152.1 T9SS type A sorting domain-containing protein [Bacteroidales bacterium]
MKEHFAFILNFITIVCLSGSISAQKYPIDQLIYNKISTETPLSSADSIALSKLPLLKESGEMLKNQLPYAVDNSDQPYFRPFYRQISVECGQYSGIAFNFCYEINRLRELPADQPENQYPAHYTFNFMNGGFGWHGVSYQHSWEIVKANGQMNVVDYGVDTGYNSRVWISGYDKYYHGMFNKIDETYQIQVGTPEGLLTLKNWLQNHLEGDDVGGIASFYSSSPWTATTLPQGTPEGGKHVVAYFSPNVGHANTIVGYNDSIRYDYNQDGQYTNDLDINGDDVIDMRDWEIGGLLFMDSYIDGVNWADSGFCYMMYKTLAETPEGGGIWNHAVHIVKPKADYEPMLTMKFNIRYNCRERIKISTGVAQDVNATYPEHILNFPIFDYQGACMNMQGGSTADSAYLEAGLDVTPLLSFIEPGQPAKYFFMINEIDPEGWGYGALEEFTLIDYTNDAISYSDTELPKSISDNGLTMSSVIASVDFSKPLISPTALPLAQTEELYEQELTCEGGKAPYKWKLLYKYPQTSSNETLPPVSGEAVVFNDTVHSAKELQLNFDFPFYGESYSSIYVHTDGFIMFDDQQYPWPYLYDEALMIRNTRIIAPFLNNYLYIDQSAGNGVWFDCNDFVAKIRWQMSSDVLNSKDIEFELRIFEDGYIEFVYGAEELFVDQNWGAGLSMGDAQNYTMASISNQQKLPANVNYTFSYPEFVKELLLIEDGLLSGTPLKNYYQMPVDVIVKDDNNMTAEKQFLFTSWYAGTDELEEINSFSVWPNPANEKIQISIQNPESGWIKVNLMDMQGKTVLTKEFTLYSKTKANFEMQLDKSISDGVYFMQIQSEKNVFNKKIIVSR